MAIIIPVFISWTKKFVLINIFNDIHFNASWRLFKLANLRYDIQVIKGSLLRRHIDTKIIFDHLYVVVIVLRLLHKILELDVVILEISLEFVLVFDITNDVERSPADPVTPDFKPRMFIRVP